VWRLASPGPARAPLLCGAAAVLLLVGGSLATYREWVDGPLLSFCLALAAGVAAGGLVVWWCAAPLAGRLWLALPLALAVVLPAPAVHATRLSERRAEVGGSLGALVEYGRVLVPVLNGEGSFSIGEDALELRAPSGSTAFVDVRWPADPGQDWRLPRALVTPAHARRREEIVWRASVDLDQRYLVLAEAGEVSIQVTDWGVLVTAPDASGDVKGESVPLSVAGAGPVEWALFRDGGRIRLLAGGRQVWSGVDTGSLAPTRIGETRSDAEHGGRLRLFGLRFRRWVT
jgi:hypothetical protein